MKIYIANESKQGLGGGFSFINNFSYGMVKYVNEASIVASWKEADYILIPSASMVSKELYREMRSGDKKIILRVDNIPRNSRNRGTGTSRLFEMATGSDAIVYQSEWAREYVGYFLKRKGNVIYNGVETSIFKKEGQKKYFEGEPVYLYSRFNRDETKRWEYAWYQYQLIQRKEPKAILVIVGQFSNEIIEYNFDFYNNERYVYLGVVNDNNEMASVYRGCKYLLATYSNDAYSNTYQEAIACGCELFNPDMSGGTPELINNGVISNESMVKNYLDLFKSL